MRGDDLHINSSKVETLINRRYHLTLPLLGSWNIHNALAALAVTQAVGISLKQGIRALKNFSPPPMRMEKHLWRGITFINDAYNANPQSVSLLLDDLKRLRPRQGRLILVLGDMRELGKYSGRYHKELADKISALKPDALFGVGEEIQVTIERLQYRDFSFPLFYFYSAVEAGNLLGSYLQRGDLVVIKGSRAVGLEETIKRAKAVIRR